MQLFELCVFVDLLVSSHLADTDTWCVLVSVSVEPEIELWYVKVSEWLLVCVYHKQQQHEVNFSLFLSLSSATCQARPVKLKTFANLLAVILIANVVFLLQTLTLSHTHTLVESRSTQCCWVKVGVCRCVCCCCHCSFTSQRMEKSAQHKRRPPPVVPCA